MARMRTIHPDICIDRGLVEMDDPRAERTFMRLWTYCDDEGRAIADSRLIKSAIYPRLDSMTYTEVDADITTLSAHGFIIEYVVNGENYLYVPSFAKWQKPNRKIASKLPPPPLTPDSVSTQCVSSDDAVSTHNNVLPVVVDVVVDVEGASACTSHASAEPKTAKGSKIPDDFKITDPMKAWAAENQIRSNLKRETDKFIDHFKAKGEAKKDWVAAWRNWLRRADEGWGGSKPSASVRDGPVVARGADPLTPDPVNNDELVILPRGTVGSSK